MKVKNVLCVLMLGLGPTTVLGCGQTTKDTKADDRDAGPENQTSESGGSGAGPIGSEPGPASTGTATKATEDAQGDAARPTDASTTDAWSSQAVDAADGSSSTRCFDPETVVLCHPEYCPYCPPAGVQEAFAATDIDERARFTRMGYHAALAEIPEGDDSRWVAVYVAASGFDLSYQVVPLEWPDAVGGYRVLDIWGWPALEDTEGYFRIAALACDQAECRLLEGSVRDSVIGPRTGYELPPELDVDGVAADSEKICVYGDGLYCNYGSGWVTEIGPGTAGRLRAVRFWGYPYVAVGDRGAFFVEMGTGDWRAVDSGTTETLSNIDFDELAVFGEEGAWIAASVSEEGEVTVTSSCHLTPPLVAGTGWGGKPLAAGTGWADNWEDFLIDREANAYGWVQVMPTGSEPATRFMCRLPNRITEPILDWGFFVCGIAPNILALTERAILAPLGGPSCVIP